MNDGCIYLTTKRNVTANYRVMYIKTICHGIFTWRYQWSMEKSRVNPSKKKILSPNIQTRFKVYLYICVAIQV